MGLAGKYEYVREEKWQEHFKALLGDKAPAGAMGKNDASLEISIKGDKVAITSNDKTRDYILNQTVDEKTFGEHSLKVIAKLDGDTLTLEISDDKMGAGKKIYSLSGSELTVTHSAGKAGVPDGKKIYKKL